jgi:seryl-tRNA synthetase
MLQLNYIRENLEEVKNKLAKKHVKNIADIDEMLKLDDEKKKLKLQVENNQAEANQIAKKIGELMKTGQKEEAETIKVRSNELKEAAKDQETLLKKLEDDIYNILVTFPNLPNEIVPEGKTPEENLNVHQWGEIPSLYE